AGSSNYTGSATETKNILDSQRSLNDVDWRELEGLRVVTNPGWIGDKEAEVEARDNLRGLWEKCK
ncbi:MAG: hypothetical protein AABY22_19400, partial [Nanoarchaeota archaeon]